MLKRWASLLLTLVMLLTMVPMTAMAVKGAPLTDELALESVAFGNGEDVDQVQEYSPGGT